MANTIHTHELQTTQTKDFDFVFVEDAAFASFRPSYKGKPPSAPVTTSSTVEVEPLRQFHEEFKNLVLDSNQAYLEREEAGWEELRLQEPIEPHEIEWLNWDVSKTPSARPIPVPSNTATPPAAPKVPTQQAIKPMVGPPLGTPPPVEIWIVKTIGVLVALNVLFAGLIVSGVRLNGYFHWLRF